MAALAGAFEIRRFALERDEGGDRATSLLCRFARQGSGETVDVLFRGVVDLVLRQTSSNLAVTPQIVSIEDRGWVDVSFKFTDPGNDTLAFYFADAELVPSHSDGARR